MSNSRAIVSSRGKSLCRRGPWRFVSALTAKCVAARRSFGEPWHRPWLSLLRRWEDSIADLRFSRPTYPGAETLPYWRSGTSNHCPSQPDGVLVTPTVPRHDWSHPLGCLQVVSTAGCDSTPHWGHMATYHEVQGFGSVTSGAGVLGTPRLSLNCSVDRTSE